MASYSILSKNIRINMEMVTKIMGAKPYFNAEENGINHYLSFMRVLLHELEHANQFRKIASDKSIEAAILMITSKITNIREGATASRDSLKHELLVIDGNYHALWEYAPHERLAEFHSYTTLLKMLDACQLFDVRLLKVYLSLILEMELFVKYGNVCPTEYYLKQMNFGDSWDIILRVLKNNEVIDDARYVLGLPVSDEFLKKRGMLIKDKVLTLRKR